jgi:hypothetical protein
MGRYRWLELQLDREDLSDEEFNRFNSELNDLQAQMNLRIAARKQELKELEDQKALEFAAQLTEEKVEKMYIDTCLKYQDVNGISFKDWYEKSLRYYSIDEHFNVHAVARSKKTKEIVAHVNLAHAKLTILTRIKYKFYDHTQRGYEFAWDIDDETE